MRDLPENGIRVTGPILRHGRADHAHSYFPMPLHLLGSTRLGDDGIPEFEPQCFLKPGPEVVCDLGRVHLPTAEGDTADLSNGFGFYLDAQSYIDVLAGRLPANGRCFSREAMGSLEFRLGIRRDDDTRTTGDDALYGTRHIRPSHLTELLFILEGLPEGWRLPSGLIPFGGEGRLAEIDIAQAPELPHGPDMGDIGGCLLVLLTPADWGLPGHKAVADCDQPWPRPEGKVPHLPGVRIVSACVEKAIRLGGWCTFARGKAKDGIEDGPSPLSLRPLVPAGSALWCRIEDASALRPHIADGLVRIGHRRASGFGLAVIAPWNDQGVETK